MIMWAATGRRYGPCPVVVQPSRACTPEPLYQTYQVSSYGYGITSPVIENGQWYNRPGGGCCNTGCQVTLDGPTTKAQITSITLDGDVLAPSAYVVLDGTDLVRVDGGCWPCCINSGIQDPPQFSVAYTIGLPIPAAVQAAFEHLACETAKACVGSVCALPARLTRLTRQGVDIEVEQIPVDQAGMVLTGIKAVDDVIIAVNPHRLTAAPMVMTPDLPPARRLT